eukprot:1699999-Prymnesium_polylepis.1
MPPTAMAGAIPMVGGRPGQSAVQQPGQPMMMLTGGMVVPVQPGQPTAAAAPVHPGAPPMGMAAPVHHTMFAPGGMLGGVAAQRSSSKNCVFPGCMKGAIGKMKLCIAHGGGKRCTVPGCNKAAQGQQPLCKAHGGGRRCQFPGCPRSARDRTDLCIGHGGGKRCAFVGCSTSARSGTLYCSLHDGVIKKHTVRMGVSTDMATTQDGQRAEPQLARNGNGVYGYMPGTVGMMQPPMAPGMPPQ